MPQNAFFLQTRDLLVSQKMMQGHFFFTLHSLSMVIFATATVLAFVLLHDSRFNFHCYTQCEATPTQKLAQKCAATSRDFLRKRLQRAFTRANQLHWPVHIVRLAREHIDTREEREKDDRYKPYCSYHVNRRKKKKIGEPMLIRVKRKAMGTGPAVCAVSQ